MTRSFHSQRYCMEPTEFELTQQHEPEEAQLFIKFAENVNGEHGRAASTGPAVGSIWFCWCDTNRLEAQRSG